MKRVPKKIAVLVDMELERYSTPDDGRKYHYSEYTIIPNYSEDKFVDRYILVVDGIELPATGSLLVLQRWYKDCDNEWVWRIDGQD